MQLLVIGSEIFFDVLEASDDVVDLRGRVELAELSTKLQLPLTASAQRRRVDLVQMGLGGRGEMDGDEVICILCIAIVRGSRKETLLVGLGGRRK